MEDNKINENISLVNEEASVIEIKNQTAVSEIQSDINLTNEQKLDYISKLIQTVDREFESSELNKKLVRQQMRK